LELIYKDEVYAIIGACIEVGNVPLSRLKQSNATWHSHYIMAERVEPR